MTPVCVVSSGSFVRLLGSVGLCCVVGLSVGLSLALFLSAFCIFLFQKFIELGNHLLLALACAVRCGCIKCRFIFKPDVIVNCSDM